MNYRRGRCCKDAEFACVWTVKCDAEARKVGKAWIADREHQVFRRPLKNCTHSDAASIGNRRGDRLSNADPCRTDTILCHRSRSDRRRPEIDRRGREVYPRALRQGDVGGDRNVGCVGIAQVDSARRDGVQLGLRKRQRVGDGVGCGTNVHVLAGCLRRNGDAWRADDSGRNEAHAVAVEP